jgi:hydroxyacylglutathione hydrolase
MKIDADLYGYTWQSMQENNCNTYLIGGDFPVIIDPGHQHLLKTLLPKMEKDGYRPENIRLVIATHGHPDHLEGAQTFTRAGAKMALHPAEEKFMQEVGPQFYQAFGLEMPELKVDFYLQEGDLKLGSKTFQVIHTPGHSPGSISLYWQEKKALFTGDVVFPMGVGRTDFPGGDGNLLRESIERLARLDAEFLLSGHGEVLKGKKNIQRNFVYIRENYFQYL